MHNSENRKALCCKDFVLIAPYSEIEADYKKFLKDPKSANWYQIEKVYPMLIPLDIEPFSKNGFLYYHYTCKNLNNDKCVIHETRPELCRAFNEDDCETLYPECISNCFKNYKEE